MRSAGSRHTGRYAPWTLSDIERAFRASWAADTCSPDDVDRADWQADNPAWGHCDVTALLLSHMLGGDLRAIVKTCG